MVSFTFADIFGPASPATAVGNTAAVSTANRGVWLAFAADDALPTTPADEREELIVRAHWAIAGVNLMLSAYLIWRVRFRASLIHVNLRIVLCYTYFTQYNMIALGRIADDLNIWLVSHHILGAANDGGGAARGAVVASNALCLVTKITHDTGLLLAANSDLLVLLERLAATLMPASYENKNSRIGVSIVMSFYLSCFALIGGVAFYDVVVAGSFSIWTSNGSCQIAALHPNALVAFWCWAVCASYIGTVALLFLYRYNKRQSVRWLGRCELTMRYQFSENVRTLRAILPAIMLNAAFFTLGLYFVVSYLMRGDYADASAPSTAPAAAEAAAARYAASNSGGEASDAVNVVHQPISRRFMFTFIYAFADVYGLIFAVIFILRSRAVRDILHNDFRRLASLAACRGAAKKNAGGGKHSPSAGGSGGSRCTERTLTPERPRPKLVGRGAGRSVSDNTVHMAKMSDKHFRQLYDMWN